MTGRFIRHERSHVGIADRVLQGHAAIVLRTLFGSHFGHIGAFHRRNDIHIQCISLAGRLVQFHGQGIVFSERQFGVTEFSIFGSPYQHIPFSGCQERLAVRIRLFGSYGIKFGIVIHLEFHFGISHRFAIRIHDGHIGFCRRGIIVNHIDFRIPGSAVHHFFRSVITSEHLGVHQHTP